MPRRVATFLAVLTAACLTGCGDAPGAAPAAAPPSPGATTPRPASLRPPVVVAPIVARDGAGLFVILDIPARTVDGIAITSAEARLPDGKILGRATRTDDRAPWSIQLRLASPEPGLVVGGALADGTSWQVPCPATLDSSLPAPR